VQTDSAWIKTAGPATAATVIAVPGCRSAWNERVLRTFLLAAKKAGADALEIDASHCNPQTASAVQKNKLRLVAFARNADAVRQASACGVDTFHVEARRLADDAIREELAQSAACVLVSSPSGCPAGIEELAADGITVIPLHDASKLLDLNSRRQSPEFLDDTGLFGWDGAGMDGIPAAVNGALAAAAGVAVVRRHLAIARYFGEQDAAGHLSQKDFREMVVSIRAAEKTLGKAAKNRRMPVPRETPQAPEIPSGAVSIYETENSTVIASELSANVAAVIDCTSTRNLDPDGVQWLAARLKKAKHLDTIRALMPKDSTGIESVFTSLQIPCSKLHKSWLDTVIKLIDDTSAHAVALVPAENALIDPSNLDRMTAQHVRSAADMTVCPDLPRGTAAVIIASAALHRISMFAGSADADTVVRLLHNTQVFRVQETIVDQYLRHPELDLTFHPAKKKMLSALIATGDETCREIIARCTRTTPELFNPTESIPGNTISFVHCTTSHSDTV